MAQATARPFLKSFGFAAAVFVVWLAVIFLSLGAPTSPEGAGRIIGNILFVTVFPALITGLWARFSGRPWSMLRLGLTYFLLLSLIAFLGAAGRLAKQQQTAALTRVEVEHCEQAHAPSLPA
jgi:hypothetical protein